VRILWLKAFHIIFMVSWFAGLFYLPRLFVYHSSCQDLISIERFRKMEKRLYYGIMLPAGILTSFSGVFLLMQHPSYYFRAAWMHTKLLLVIILWGYHFFCGRWRKAFSKNCNTHSANFYRWVNEFPTVLLIALVILAVVKPSLSR